MLNTTALRLDTSPALAAAAAANDLVQLTEDQIDAVAGGYEPRDMWGRPENPDFIYYGVGYLLSRGLGGTFKDFAWQVMN